MPSEKRVIALRLDDATRAQLEKLAAAELRSVANMAEIVIRLGLQEMASRVGRLKVKK